jgi:ligand-binding sensor domain-containing protein
MFMKSMHLLFLSFLSLSLCNGQDKKDVPNDISESIISCGLKDRLGNLWFAVSGKGAYRYGGKSFSHFTMKEGLRGDNIACIYEDRTGNVWFGTENGICRYDGRSFSDFDIPDAASTSSGHGRKIILADNILQDKAGNFWYLTLYHGVYRYDGKSLTNFLPNEVLVCMLADRKGNIWAGSWRQGGLYRYDGTSFTNFDGVSDNMIASLIEDKAGNIWIGTRDHGADRYDGKSIVNFSEKDGLCNTNVSCMFQDKAEHIWFGSDARGIEQGNACRYNGKTFTNVTAKEKFAMKPGAVYSVRTIVEDNAGNIWLGSRGGLLLRFNGIFFVDFSQILTKT